MAKTQEEPRPILASDIDAAAQQHGLTTAEAEGLLRDGKLNDKEVQKVKEARVVFRPHYEYVSGAESNPLAVADARRAAEAKADEDKVAPAADKTAPEAGPYGPNAEYTAVEAPNDTDHTSPRQPAEEG
jgi:hypothetical protein